MFRPGMDPDVRRLILSSLLVSQARIVAVPVRHAVCEWSSTNKLVMEKEC